MKFEQEESSFEYGLSVLYNCDVVSRTLKSSQSNWIPMQKSARQLLLLYAPRTLDLGNFNLGECHPHST